MLNVTARARDVIRELLVSQPDGGLRLAPSQPDGSGAPLEIGVALASHPASTDQVVAVQGARIFIDEKIVAVLTDRTLDVQPPGEEAATVFRLVRTSRQEVARRS